MKTFRIAESLIREHCIDQSFKRGQEYARSHSVSNLIWRSPFLQASVAGSEYYRVSIEFNDQAIKVATCTCPYDLGGWCKHIVAALLQANQQSNIEERPSLKQMIEQLNLEQTRKLLYNLVTEAPELIDQIDFQVAILTSSKTDKSQSSAKSGQAKVDSESRPQIDRTPFVRHISSIIHSVIRHNDYHDYYEENPFSDELTEEVAKAQKFIEAGDSFRAFIMLYAIAEGLVEHIDDIEDFTGDASSLVEEVDQAMAEAILWTDFSIEERQRWQVDIEGTADLLGTELELSLAALIQGWDDSEIKLALQEPQNEDIESSKDGIQTNFVGQLNFIRLSILQAQGRFEEYLNLAQAANLTSSYVNMLIQLGRIEQAIAAANHIKNVASAFSIAKQFLKYEVETEALYIAHRGLQFQGDDLSTYLVQDLAVWTVNLAEKLGETDILLAAKICVFKLNPTLKDYHTIRDLTREQWQSIQQDLLQNLITGNHWVSSGAKVDIFLEEGMIDQAIAIAEFHSCKNELRVRVMQAAISTNPAWVIAKATPLVADILNRGKSEIYNEAIALVTQIRNAYLASKNEQDWLTYRNQLVSTYGKKRKFMELLKQKGY